MILSLIVSDAACGVNIAEKYPRFYQQMLADPALREQFEGSLDLLRQTRNNTLEPLSGPLSRDLSFLRPRPQPDISLCTDGTGWQLTISLSLVELTHQFFPSPTKQVTRSGISLGLDEDNWFNLFRGTVKAEGGEWTVWLEGTPMDEEEDNLHVVLFIYPDEAIPEKNRTVQARLQWGPYQETAPIDSYGRASFPPLPLNQVVDVEAQRVRFELSLEVHSYN